MVSRRLVQAFMLLGLVGHDIGARAQYVNCTHDFWIQDGWCDMENNNEACLYDGGDCCSCTCVGGNYYGCGSNGFSCMDPDAPDLVQFNCEEIPPTSINCPVGLQREWIVDNASQARALGEAVRCSGGAFNVFWKGRIIVNEMISILEDTVLNITGGDTNAAIIGDGKNRLFTVVNASLYLSNVAISNGHATYGGAIAASRSRLFFERVIFKENNATMGGGALSLSDGTVVSFGEKTAFVENTAVYGGALYVTNVSTVVWRAPSQILSSSDQHGCDVGNITISWNATAQFVGNLADEDGGAVYLSGGSTATWSLESLFSSNNAQSRSGGALYITGGSTATWTAVSRFSNNGAVVAGGALRILGGSNATWSAESLFSFNSAIYYGGALSLTSGSNATWNAESLFSFNSASEGSGGALASSESTVVWNARSRFYANSARNKGGALNLIAGSTAAWTAESLFSSNNGGSSGGALHLSSGSNAAWTAVSNFSANEVDDDGGALYLTGGSVASWVARSFFSANIAIYRNGGALHLDYGSTAVWSAESFFSTNSAFYSGGALYLVEGSSAEWSAESFFYANTAIRGGALYLWGNAYATWSAESCFSTNKAEYGGALYLEYSSSVTWTAVSIFYNNSAENEGGAVYAKTNVALIWSNDSLFLSNASKEGGALFLIDGVIAELSGENNFTFNRARLNGGAVGSRAYSLGSDDTARAKYPNGKGSVITIKGATSFTGNKCGANGGVMALVQSVAVSCESEKIVFSGNYAGGSGGAVYITGINIGIVFKGVLFIGNVARNGGAVYVTASGTGVTINEKKEQEANPTTFEGCSFVENFAFGTGGAVDSASSKDVFNHTFFVGNQARVGGALRLAGKASIVDCSFDDNVSELGGGPAVSNIGYISTVAYSLFRNNVFNCEYQAFLDFNQSSYLLEAVCEGCPASCVGCSFREAQGSPTCTSLSQAGVEHATSDGGTGTVENLRIHKGYWRATNTSLKVYQCFNTKACAGGLTGSSEYCLVGYEGPYCSICSTNYVSSLRFTCRECSDPTLAIAMAAVFAMLASAVGLAIVSYLVSTEAVGDKRTIVDHVMQRIPMQSVKITIVMWQIMTQFTSVANITFPNVYEKFLDGVDFFNFDLSWVVSMGCFVEVDFHDRLLCTTIAPFVIMCFLGVTYAVAVQENRGSSASAQRIAQDKHVSMALLITFLVYSSVSSVVFQMFACENLDDGKRYLRADYSIECDSPKHRALQIYAGVMILLYPVGIPALYTVMLVSKRDLLRDGKRREESLVVRSTSSLWKQYKPQTFYYEVIECGRRILLAGVVVFMYPNTASQVAVALVIALVFVFLSEAMAPYQSRWDAWISRTGHAIVFVTVYLALLLKVDVSGENDSSQKMFEVILVVSHGCMILAIVVQVVIMTLFLWRGKQREDPRPRLRRLANMNRKVQACLIEEDNGCKEEL